MARSESLRYRVVKEHCFCDCDLHLSQFSSKLLFFTPFYSTIGEGLGGSSWAAPAVLGVGCLGCLGCSRGAMLLALAADA